MFFWHFNRKKVIDVQQVFVLLATAICSCWARRICGMFWKSIQQRECGSRRLRSRGWKSTKKLHSRKVNGKSLTDLFQCCSKFFGSSFSIACCTWNNTSCLNFTFLRTHTKTWFMCCTQHVEPFSFERFEYFVKTEVVFMVSTKSEGS